MSTEISNMYKWKYSFTIGLSSWQMLIYLCCIKFLNEWFQLKWLNNINLAQLQVDVTYSTLRAQWLALVLCLKNTFEGKSDDCKIVVQCFPLKCPLLQYDREQYKPMPVFEKNRYLVISNSFFQFSYQKHKGKMAQCNRFAKMEKIRERESSECPSQLQSLFLSPGKQMAFSVIMVTLLKNWVIEILMI